MDIGEKIRARRLELGMTSDILSSLNAVIKGLIFISAWNGVVTLQNV